jgi:hypothetical protein
VLHVIDPVFQMAGKVPRLQFAIGTTAGEREALRVLRDLIVGKSHPHLGTSTTIPTREHIS